MTLGFKEYVSQQRFGAVGIFYALGGISRLNGAYLATPKEYRIAFNETKSLTPLGTKPRGLSFQSGVPGWIINT